MLREFLQDSWTFQQTLEEGRVEGRIEGRVEEVQRNIETMVQARFPDLCDFVKSKIAFLADREKLQRILLIVGTAQAKEEVERFLLLFQ